jgi:hypothetical protein
MYRDVAGPKPLRAASAFIHQVMQNLAEVAPIGVSPFILGREKKKKNGGSLSCPTPVCVRPNICNLNYLAGNGLSARGHIFARGLL